MPFPTLRPRPLVSLLLVLACSLATAQTAPHPAPVGTPAAHTPVVAPPGAPSPALAPPAPAAAAEPTTALSRDARRIYELSRDKLVQIRTLLRNANTQASIGSGFFVSNDGLIVTNFHVASQLALEPERYRAVYVTMEGQEGEAELLAFDVQRDLAVLRAKARTARAPVLHFRPAAAALAQGERIYSLGNPLDIGFAVTEGTYNGLVRRSFYPRIFFGGTLNPGMSGGPAVDDAGRVLGVNVAKRLDGEEVSFLVPAEFAQALVQRAANAQPITQPAYGEVTKQLLVHQQLLTERFLKTPFQEQRHGNYRVPVPDDALARCWGSGRDPNFPSLNLQRTKCQADSHVVAGDFNTGTVHMGYEAYDAPTLGAARFARVFSQSFGNEPFLKRGNRHQTAVECTESYVDAGSLPMRAVVCMSAYRKLPGLYDMTVLALSINQPTQGVLGRMDVQGVAFDNGMKLASHYLQAFRWEAAP
ncbi:MULTISPECIES: serine protease [unclassified Simplicispira]|uniref:S1 family peptidase n=1 Tax=unclassified Simplicispira TaxID=2630407 RepID=UPI000D5FAF16|nr:MULTISPECIES: serine protease [unclassified Simplicispira]PVY56547.1 S1-C subfamily serine protease [Simplicispira sp. 125]REG17492.1 S1-C subfamily serine protease [Simplicispira sp. 110]